MENLLDNIQNPLQKVENSNIDDGHTDHGFHDGASGTHADDDCND